MKKKKTVVFAPTVEEQKPKPVVTVKEYILEDAILILNPLYFESMNDVHQLLEEIGFTVIDRDKITITSKQSNDIFKRRYKDSRFRDEIIDHFSAANTAFFHVTKLNANKEIDEIMKRNFTKWSDVLEFQLLEKPLKIDSFPFLFVPMDSPQMYETSLELVCPEAVKFWGQDIVKFSHLSRERTLNRIIQSTIGDGIKRDPKTSDLMIKLFYNSVSESKSVHFVATTPKQGMFEVRIQNKYGSLNSDDKISKKRAQYLDRFHSLSMYYTRLCNLSDDFCPSFYRFRICPDSSYKLHRVFEIEEYTGEQFMYQVLKESEEYRKHEVTILGEVTQSYYTKQGSLPSYLYGFKLSKLAEKLQELTYNDIPEVGKIRFNRGDIIASTSISEFYSSEKEYFYWLIEQTIPIVKKFYPDSEKEFVTKFEELLCSFTFKESRKAEYIRLVPDRIDSINLRIYNKSEFVTDEFLKHLEEKLNIEFETIAREKYFQGKLSGYDYSLIEKFENLKKGEDPQKREERLEEIKKNMKREKSLTPKKLGSIDPKEKEDTLREHELERTRTVLKLERKLNNQTNDESLLNDLSSKRQEIIDKKGVAISGIVPAKYTKEHVAASLFFFVNFTMREVKRDELIQEKILSNNKDFDEVIKGITFAFEKNYKFFETTHKPPNFLEEENELERHYKNAEKSKKKSMKAEKEEEERKRFLRCTCTPEEAIKMVADDMFELKEQKRDVIRSGYVIRDDARLLNDTKMSNFKSKFLKVAEHGLESQTMLGPVLDDEIEHIMTKYQDEIVFHDKLSFFRMEYLLYCLRELYRINEDTEFLKDDLNYYLKKVNQKDDEINRMRYSRVAAEKAGLDSLEREARDLRSKMAAIDRDIDQKNSFLKKLITHILEWRVKAKPTYNEDFYGLPLSTFWRPLDLNEKIDTDYDKEQYRMDIVEHLKKRNTLDLMKFKESELLDRVVEDITIERKFERTYLGYSDGTYKNEELVFKQLDCLKDKF